MMLRFLWTAYSTVSLFLTTHLQLSLFVDMKSLTSLRQWFSALSIHQCHLAGWLKPRVAVPWECLGCSSRINSSRKFSGFPGGSDGKESACNAGDAVSILRLGSPPGEENGYPLQYSCLENSMDRGAQQATVHGVEKSRT